MAIDPKQLMQPFLTALHRRDLTACTALLQEIASIAATQSAARGWHEYFVAVLHHESDGDFAMAERRYRALLQISDLDPFLSGQIRISLTSAIMQVGNYSGAVATAQTAIELFHALAEPLEEAKAWCQLGLASYLGHNAGDFDAEVLMIGVTACQTALDILGQRAADSQASEAYTMVWNTMGLLHTSLLHWESAIACYEQLLLLCQQAENHFGTAIAQSNLGQAYRKLGQAYWMQAQAAFTAALVSFRVLQRPGEEIAVLADLALLYHDIGQTAQGLATFAEALILVETVRARHSSDAARAGFLATVTDLFANAVLYHVQAGALAQAFAYVEQARARAFLDLLDAGAVTLEPAKSIAPLSLRQIQAALPADAVLFEYFTTGLIESPDRYTLTTIRAERPGFPQAATLLFVVTRTTLDVFDTYLSPNDLYPSAVDAPVEEHFLDPALRSALYTSLLAPAAHRLHGKRVIYVAPHGPLHYVPFQALVGFTGETLLQQAGPQLIYTPSASILLRAHRAAQASGVAHPSEQARRPCLAIGCNSVSLPVSQHRQAPAIQLHYAEEEAAAIAELTGGIALVGDHPKKEQLFQMAGDYEMLHFSCHGAFDAMAPFNSALHLAADELLTAQEVFDRLRIRCNLVILSACASGLSRVRRGDELYGLARAFMVAGASALVVTQWRVDERATYLLMCQLHTLLKQGIDPATALHRAQWYLRTLSAQTALATLTHIQATRLGLSQALQAELTNACALLQVQPPTSTPFADPYFWAPFILIYG